MNIFSIFGNPKPKSIITKPPSPREIIIDIRNQISTLEKRSALLEDKIKQCIELAKQKAFSDKAGALAELNKKKLLEEELTKNNGTIMLLERQVMSLESNAVNQNTIAVLKKSNAFLQSTVKSEMVDNTNELLDSIEDQFDISRSISDALSRPIQILSDDSDMLGELEALKEEITLPDVPTNPIPIQREKKSEETELQQLADFMT